MSQKVDLLKVFISCPGDVDDERKIVREVCKSISNVTCKVRNIEVKPIDYKENIIPQITGKEAQEIINDQLEKEAYDIYIGIMWHRFGDPLSIGETPTENEFNIALDLYNNSGFPLIQFYFKRSEYEPINDYEKDQVKKVASFKSKIQDLGLYKGFQESLKFQESVNEFILLCVEKFQIDQSLHCPIPKNQYEAIGSYLTRSIVKNQSDDAESFFYKETIYDLVEILKEKNKVILIGDAGIGKTSELKRVANYFSDKKTIYYPFWISLNTYIEQDIEDLFNPSWKAIPSSALLFILDGFDEIESKYKRDFVKQIELFSGKYPEVTILLSCRTNFYKAETAENSGIFAGFKSYFLKELDKGQINEYSNNELGSKAKRFLRSIEKKKIDDLVAIPFYLIELVNLFKDTDSLPVDRATIVEKLIQSRMNFDIKHFKNYLELKKQKIIAFENLKVIALVMETLGRNYIDDQEYKLIIVEEGSRELLSHCTAWKKCFNGQSSITWQFEHSNIQEFLAADQLKAFTFSSIKSFIAFEPDFVKIIPSWVNTISFLLSIIQSNELIDWILEIEPEIVIKFEPDRVEENRRVQIIKDIFNSYQSKKIGIDNDRFRHGELGSFCNSVQLIDFLIEAGSKEKDPMVISNAISIIWGMEIPFSRKKKIETFLVHIILDQDSPGFLKNRTLTVLADSKLVSESVADKIVSVLKNETKDWIRSGLYKFLIKSSFVDRHIDVFLDGIQYIGSRTSRLLNEQMNLRAGLQKVYKPKALRSIISHITQSDAKSIRFLFGQDLHITKIVEHSISAYQNEVGLYTDMLELFVFVKKQFLGGTKVVGNFFLKTNTQADAFEELLSKGIRRNGDLLAILADKENLEYVTQKYREKKLDQTEVQEFLYSLNFNNYEFYEQYFASLNTEFENRFEKMQQIDYEKIRKKQNNKDIALLFNKDEFLKEIKLIFKDSSLETLNHKYFFNLQTDFGTEKKYANVVTKKLSKLFLNKEASLEEALLKMDSLDWESFWTTEIYEKLTNNPNESMLSDTQKDEIIAWVYEQIPSVNFKNAITKTGPSNISINYKEIIIWFFIKKYKLVFPEDILLDMLSFDFEGDIIPYLEKLLDIDQISSQILENVYNGDLCGAVLENHLKFCQRHKINNIIEFALDEIVDSKSDLRSLALELICELSLNLNSLLEKLPSITDDFKWNLIDKLVESKNSKIEAYLSQIFETGKENEKYRASIYLIKFQSIKAIAFYIGELKKLKIFTRTFYASSPLGLVSDIKAMPLILDLFKYNLKKTIETEDKHGFDTIERLVNRALTTIALNEDQNFIIVKETVESFIKNHIDEHESVKWLYSLIEKIEMQYYINKSKDIRIEDAIIKVRQ
jgi:hypothetical protein